MSTHSSCLNGLILYRPTILLSTDTNGQVYLWSLETYETISHVKVHEHSVLTRNRFKNKIFTGGKEGGGADNVCGLNCSLKSCDLEMLLQGENVQPAEHGFPCVMLWEAKVEGETMVVCLKKRGKPYLDFWDLNSNV